MNRKKLEHLKNQTQDIYSSANYIKREVYDKHMKHGDGIDAICGLLKDMALITTELINERLNSDE